MRLFLRWLALFALLQAATPAAAFDHRHAAWGELLQRHVVVARDGNASRLRYAAMRLERPALQAYLASLSAVGETEYASWNRPQRLAFLINAYNAFTVDLILGAEPGLASIRDLGNFLRSPWKRKFFVLLGRERSLDEIEHEMLRAPGAFDEPRIHVALVCASVGCPMLRAEPYVAERIGAQLEDGMRRFLSDRSRNRYDAASDSLRVSRIFDWYGRDFEQGHQGFASLRGSLAAYAELLADDAAAQARIRAGRVRIEFLEYDWRLNGAD